jgi:tRNA pseudouridine38-40 synthase
MHTIKLIIAFDGTDFRGWQRQKSGQTIQGEIEDRLRIMTRSDISLEGAGRTDAGVHARGMVASFKTPSRLTCQAFQQGLNSLLPDSIRILAATEASPDFHARFDARAKTYCYHLDMNQIQLPHQRLYALHIPVRLDLELIQHCLGKVIGEHDFASFEASGSRDLTKTTGRGSVRTILDASLHMTGIHFVTLTFSGDGFLRHMVRNLVGTLIDVGKGRTSSEAFSQILATADRKVAGATAPAHGLFLDAVHYGQDCPGLDRS